MIATSLSNASLILGAHPIFKNLTWEIQHDQKIGLIGPNGAGKSSLFKLIIGEFSPEPGGGVVRAKGVTVGYLPQQPEFNPGQTAFEIALDGNPRVADAPFSSPRKAWATRRCITTRRDFAGAGRTVKPWRVHAWGESYPTGSGIFWPRPAGGDLAKSRRALSGARKLANRPPDAGASRAAAMADNHWTWKARLLERLISDYPGVVIISRPLPFGCHRDSYCRDRGRPVGHLCRRLLELHF
jgi:energy-coupling factor transporter ATP-binding protein EcfA2